MYLCSANSVTLSVFEVVGQAGVQSAAKFLVKPY